MSIIYLQTQTFTYIITYTCNSMSRIAMLISHGSHDPVPYPSEGHAALPSDGEPAGTSGRPGQPRAGQARVDGPHRGVTYSWGAPLP